MILLGDALTHLKELPDESVQCCVTSPPYWNLRDYGVDGQMGLENTPENYINALRAIFEQVKRALKADGTLWLNLGDSYAAPSKNRTAEQAVAKSGLNGGKLTQSQSQSQKSKIVSGLKCKDLVGIPWMVAFALRSDGWYLRQDIIWHKPNPMPESVRDRCTKAHEYIFLMSKSAKYFFDIDSIKEPAKHGWRGSEFHTGKTGTHQLGRSQKIRQGKITGRGGQGYSIARGNDRDNSGGFPNLTGTRQKRSVWTVPSKPFKGAHFATFPPGLIEPCILAGSKAGDTVLDPFFGAGTVGMVAAKHGRKWIGIELNPKYVAIAEDRLGLNQMSLEIETAKQQGE